MRILEEALNLKAGDPFSEARTTVGAIRVQIEYQRLGYFDALVQADTENVVGRMQGDDALVIIHLKITQGRRHIIRPSPSRTPRHRRRFPKPTCARGCDRWSTARTSRRKSRRTRKTCRTFTSIAATVRRSWTVRPQLQVAGDEVHVTLKVLADEGPQIMVGSITIVGNNRFREARSART
jgi:outer membrane protein assembly factor BamA